MTGKQIILFRFFFLSFLVTSSVFSFAQEKTGYFPPIRDMYNSWVKDRPFTYRDCDTFFYADRMDTLLIEKIKTFFVTDNDFDRWTTPYEDTTNKEKIKFTLEERNYILDQLDQLKQNVWQFHMFPHAQVVPISSIRPLLEKTDKSNISPNKKICKEIHTFSKPFFFRNNTLCLFYTGKCNIFTKEGECCVYRKEHDAWKKYAIIYQWAGFD